MTNKLADLRWICTELDDIALLLRTHGIEELANQLDAIRENLRLSRDRKPKKRNGLGIRPTSVWLSSR
jgi:hypothetical protein